MKKNLLLLSFLFILGNIYAQRQMQNSLYYFNALSYNPAYVGSQDALSVDVSHRIQWTGIEGAPRTTFLSVHSPIKKTQLSVGADLMYDKVGVSKTTAAYLDVGYHIQTNKNGNRLSFALKGGFSVFDLALSDLKSPPDALKKDISNEMKGNFGAGLYYYGQKFSVGFSALSILKNSVFDEDEVVAFILEKPHYYLTAAYFFDLNNHIKFRPTAIIKAVEGESVSFEIDFGAFLYKKLWLGTGYRYEESIRGYLLVHITPEFRIGYNYEYIFNDLTKYTGGSHEFMLSYELHWGRKNSLSVK